MEEEQLLIVVVVVVVVFPSFFPCPDAIENLWLLEYKESLRESVHSVVLCDWRRSIGMKWLLCCCCLCRRSLNSSRRRRRRTVVESNLVDEEVDDLRQSKRRTTTMMTKERGYGNFSLLTSFGLLLLFLCQQVSLAAVHHQRISGSAGDVLEDNPVGRLKVFVYELPSKYNKKWLEKDPRCLTHMFAAEEFVHDFLLASPVRTMNPEEADWFYTPVYTTCDLTPNGLPLPFKSPRMMRSAISYISTHWPFWNRTEGGDHFFVVPHDFGACFHYQEEKAIERGVLPLLKRSTLVQTFGQNHHVCLKEGSIVVPPYAPPEKMQSRFIPPSTPRSIFVYFRGLFYDVGNDPEGGYYARGARAAVWENFKDNPLFDISTQHPSTYYEDMQRAIFCLCPLGWAPWSPRLVEGVIFGCIPVIIADDIVLPFADAIPWEKIGVFVAEKDVPNLDKILSLISPEEVLEKQRLLANPAMKQAMLFSQPTLPGDAFHQILNGLARKLPHDPHIYLKPGQTVLNWTEGPAGDLKPW